MADGMPLLMLAKLTNAASKLSINSFGKSIGNV
jgi:hypothetical protein